MGCGSCSSGACGSVTTAGCKNNGTCGTGGCNKLNAFDWLGNMELPGFKKFDIVEVKFKGGRKDFFRNIHGLELYAGDPVVVDVQNGHHIGFVSLQGDIVRLQMRKKKVQDNDEIRIIYRKATEKDLEKLEEVKNRELPTLYRTRQIIGDLNLQMKLSDVEYQADNTKATFYYSADDRVDFRELIKLLAGEFRIRVEMRQISLRQEASRIGGIGSCGRELCCSTWLTEFKSVSTSAARYQNLSLNPSKLSGQCGRLKCCLNYELETYLDALVDIPKITKPLQTIKGNAHLQKVDIFKKIMWFCYDEESTWYPLDATRVNEILRMNEKGQKPDALAEDTAKPSSALPPPPDYANNFSTDMDRFADKEPKKSKRRKKKSNNRKPENQKKPAQQKEPGQIIKNTAEINQPGNEQPAHKPNFKRRKKRRPGNNQNPNQNNKKE